MEDELMSQLFHHSQQHLQPNSSTTMALAPGSSSAEMAAVMLPPADAIDESHLWSVHSTSELVEMLYQMCFFAVGAPLNAIALRNFYKKRSKAHSGEMRLIRLSRQLLIAHLMVLCIYCLWRTHWIWNIHWTLGNPLCKAYSFLSALPFHLWSNMVAAIAIDMLYCIRVPLGSVPNGNRRVTWLIAIAWILAILCAAPMTIFRGTRPIPNTPFMQCYHLQGFTNEQIMAFHFFHVITTFYLPLMVILFCYVSIGLSLRHQGASLRQGNCLANTDQHKRMQQNTKLRFLKATAAIVCAFVLSWLPYQVMALLRVVCEADSKCEQLASNFNWLQSILLASTCINPFLYRFGIFRSRSSSGENRRKTTACLLGGANGGSMAYFDSQAAPAIYLPNSPIGKSTASGYEPNSSIRSNRSTQSAMRTKKLSDEEIQNNNREYSPISIANCAPGSILRKPNGSSSSSFNSATSMAHYQNGQQKSVNFSKKAAGCAYQRLENGGNCQNKQLHPFIQRHPSPL